MEFESNYDISRVADFIHSNNFTRVALQFPDEMLKDSSRVASAIRHKLCLLEDAKPSEEPRAAIKLYVMADTTYGSCCVDEVGAAHVNAQCVIHYGHSCLSPTTTIPALCIFGKASIGASSCAESLCNYASKRSKPVLVLFGLEYAHALPAIGVALTTESMRSHGPKSGFEIHYADVFSSVINPEAAKTTKGQLKVNDNQYESECLTGKTHREYRIGGLVWSLPEDHRMEDYLLFWIGADDAAFSNVVITFNSSEIVRYDATESCLMTDVSQQRKILKRRYYLVEKAKDANMVGILIGTLGVAGYLHMIHQMKELVTRAGKKAYTFVMGRPNPAKLANFPECDVFIYVSCAQTALLDSKDFLAPIITPFEAMLAYNRGSRWTGAYVMEFQDLIASSPVEVKEQSEARFSFLEGGYVEESELQGDDKDKEGVLSLVNITQKALQLRNKDTQLISSKSAKSGAEFFAARTFQGLDLHYENATPEPFLIGRSGKASAYEDEQN
ncbi:hypothetical protein M9H77_26743 [Catharanthus roseus]|uniref:Uncharacterized protein n=1 Tax=Catharanthus roseus TaxID=4058 RepID=A0ACC0ACE8_CATRO|nr:hypothetical protein M9H77_26743 [Catharanthus roseus]